ncbi:MAG TPA: hypothetical protein VM616_10210 [Gammaproteobacteria bacterium]|nr:hypothetical protein [Gammaproteobacteria bacterium]
MDVCHAHNLIAPHPERPRNYGLRVSLPPDDPLIPILGADWQQTDWYPTAEERDAALADKSALHLYSRRGDLPRLVFEKVERQEGDPK